MVGPHFHLDDLPRAHVPEAQLGVAHGDPPQIRGGGSSNRSCCASLARARSMAAVGFTRILAANRSSHPFHSAEPRMVMAFGWLGMIFAAGLAAGFFAMSL